MKASEIVNPVFSSNRLTSADFRYYNSAGQATSNVTTNFQYDANGYQTQKSYGGYTYNSVITGGNTVSINRLTAGSANIITTTLEYYTDKPNKLNVNLFEHWYQDDIL